MAPIDKDYTNIVLMLIRKEKQNLDSFSIHVLIREAKTFASIMGTDKYAIWHS